MRSVRRCSFSMTRAGKPFPVLCTVLSIETSTHVLDSDYRPDSKATNLKSEGRMAAPRVNALAAGLDPLPKRTFHVARSAIRSINKFRADFLVSFEQSGRQSETPWFSCSAGFHSHSQRSGERVAARLLCASNQCQLDKESLDQIAPSPKTRHCPP